MTAFIAWGQDVSYDKTIPQPIGNTLPIVDFAYQCGFDGVELDVQLSKDGVLVLMHDWTIDATTNGTGRVSNYTVAELKEFAVNGEWQGATGRISTFEEALLLNGDRGSVMCDLRQVTPRTIQALHDAIENSGFDRTKLLIIAYTRETALTLKAAFPGSLVMLKSPANPPELTVDFMEQAEGLDAILVNCARFPDLVRQFKAETTKRNMKLCVYLHHRGLTMQLLRELVEIGADYITTQNHQFFEAARATTLPR